MDEKEEQRCGKDIREQAGPDLQVGGGKLDMMSRYNGLAESKLECVSGPLKRRNGV